MAAYSRNRTDDMRTKTLYKADRDRLKIDRFPCFHITGSIAGMKRMFYGKDALAGTLWKLDLQRVERTEDLSYSTLVMKRSHKAEFQRWRAELEAKHGMMIYDRLSDVIDTNDDLTVGDMVLFTNDYGVTFGPHEILGFCKPDSFLCPHRYPKDEDCGIVFLDSDAYWFPDRLNQLTLVSKGGQQ